MTLVTMYDSVDVSTVPPEARAVAGYVDGNYRSFTPLVRRFYPHAHCISITVTGNNPAEVVDVETGDVRPQHAPGWVKRMLERGHWKPCIYASLSIMPEVKHYLDQVGLRRDQYRLWCADWTGHPHIPHGYDACQWTDRALGRNLDASLCAPSFWKPITKQKRIAPHPKVLGSTAGAAITTAIVAVLNRLKVPVDMPLVVGIGTFIAGYLTPARR